MISQYRIEAVVVGVSTGGTKALPRFLSALPENFPAAVIVVQHRAPSGDIFYTSYLNNYCFSPVKEAEDKELIEPGVVYVSPADYHLLVEKNRMFSFSCEGPVRYSRPSIDVLFETAASAYRDALVGVVLTGANNDGSHGVQVIKKMGGITLAQDPEEAEASQMPQAAIDTGKIDIVLPLAELSAFLIQLIEGCNDSTT